VELDPGSDAHGAVFDVVWHPPVDEAAAPRFASLLHLVESVIRRFEARGYEWNRSDRFLDEKERVLERLYALERDEVARTRRSSDA